MIITSLIRRESTPKLFLGLEGPMAVILRPTSFLRFLGSQTPKNRSHNEQNMKNHVKIWCIFGENYENRKNQKIARIFLILTRFYFCKKKNENLGQFRLSRGDDMSKKQFLCFLEHFYEIIDFCCSLDLKLMRFKRFQIDEVVSEGGLGSQKSKKWSWAQNHHHGPL